MTSPFLSLPGAVGEAVALHYGAPLQEQRALAEGNALVDLSHRGIVTVSGPDRLSWLNSMTSQQLLNLAPGESTETLLLDPNGRIEHAMRVVDDGETTWLLVDEGSAEPLFTFLNRMRFALRVEVADVSADYAAVLAFAGGTAVEVLQGFEPTVAWVDPWAEVTRGGAQYAHGEHAGANWSAIQFVLPVDRLAAVSRAVAPAGLMSLDALEIRAWRPSRVSDVDERAIPHEFDWLRSAVHLTKGCYRGQETVAKVHNLGHPPRRLVMLHLDGSEGELPVAGALVFREGEAASPEARPVGRITRAALHYEWGAIAFALLKRSVPGDVTLAVRAGTEAADPSVPVEGVISAAQEMIVPTDAGATRTIPKLKRL
ncbi:CAF17-like 4Fe-4S cluster assembly/insertion protein YgfZ [Leucobacter aridicollis]|uniref:CAF17-like 4Fe-4S cluster assembly/insertion protein YgfZ n=1 Tax=Leucobacter aridicollis TaxID=283878 RepID=UPI002107DE2F|nr:folate-binding protein [Leucobacter aridicollis]UTX52711.1 folate-binding protein YgfZ [Leucobacter aridicollis]